MDAKKFYENFQFNEGVQEGDFIISPNDLVSLMDQYAKEKVKEVVKQIHSQSKDGAITSDWIGFKSFID